MSIERESMEFDILIVGGGPAGLSAAIRLKQQANEAGRELSVCVIEKAAEIGAHILSGASRLTLTDDFKPDIEGEYIGFGAVLSWDEGDVATRIYDDLLNLAHQAEYCDRMGEVMIPLGDPGALGAWFQRMGQRFEAIGLIDRLIYALSIGD